MKKVTFSVILLLVSALGVVAQSPPPVPTGYQSLYNELDLGLATFEAKINAFWDGTKTGTAFSSESLYSSSNNGPLLWDPHHVEKCKTEISRLKAIGLQMVTFSVHFPYLYQPFFSDETHFLKYKTFYSQIAQYARSLGLKIAVETQVVFPDSDTTGAVQAYYDSLTWQQHKTARNATAQLVATIMKPDYLTLISEPDTEVDLTGQTHLESPSGISEMIAPMAHDVKALNIPNMKIGAGSGSWYLPLYPLVTAMLSIPEVDYYSLHVYPVSGTTLGSFAENCLMTVRVAKQYGKVAAIGETWNYKESMTEYGQGLTAFNILRRDPFSFWSPLDIKAIRTYMKMAYWGKMPFMSTYYTRYFFSYIEYNNETRGLSYTQMVALSTQTSEVAMNAGKLTDTGTSYSGFVKGTIPLK